MGIGAYMVDAKVVKCLDGATQAAVMPVEGVIVGGEHHVKAGIFKGSGVAVGGAEAWIAAVGSATQRCLEVNYGIVGFLYDGGECSEAFRVVIGAIGLVCGFYLGLVHHGVAGK